MEVRDGETPESGNTRRESPEYEEFFRYAENFGVELTPGKKELIRTYVSELLRWNRKTNLTSSNDIREILIVHVLDSLVSAVHLGEVDTLVDVGSGAGFPGIPIKIVRPEIHVWLVESRRKKASFLRHVVNLLGLSGIRALCSRAEDPELNKACGVNPPDTLITRAAVKDRLVLKLGQTLLKPNGKIILMKGELSAPDKEALQTESLNQGRSITRVIPYRLPGMRKERTLVVIQRDP